MVGVWPHPNPHSYASYDEIWQPCKCCKGVGKTWKAWVLFPYWIGSIKYKVWEMRHVKKGKPEKDIPF